MNDELSEIFIDLSISHNFDHAEKEVRRLLEQARNNCNEIHIYRKGYADGKAQAEFDAEMNEKYPEEKK